MQLAACSTGQGSTAVGSSAMRSKEAALALTRLARPFIQRRTRSVRCDAVYAAPWPAATASFYLPSTSYSTESRRAAATLAPPSPLGYELVQGNLVRYSTDAHIKSPPTAVLVHGILGSRRNLQSFAHLIVEVLLVDLRCHGESASATTGSMKPGPHTVATAAQDVLALLRSLRIFPHMLVGHSFGGKVVMSMAQQFGSGALPRPVQVWVLDTLPGEVRAGGSVRQDHPADLIRALQRLGDIVPNRAAVQDHLANAGFSETIARWVTTNLRAVGAHGGAGRAVGSPLRWTFDLGGVADMFESYERTSLWPLLREPPQGLQVDFVRAERSEFRWGGADEALITSLGHHVHLLRNSGHWVHSDNPGGLFDILAPTFHCSNVDLHVAHSEAGRSRR